MRWTSAATDGSRDPDTRQIVAGLRRRTPLILACMLLAAASALGFSLLQTKEYSAQASLLFRDPGFDQQLFGSSIVQTNNDPTGERATNVKLVSLGVVADRTARALGHGLSGKDVSNAVSIGSDSQSNVVSITATDHSPRFAATLANTFASQYIDFRRSADRRKVAQARQQVQANFEQLPAPEQQGGEGVALQRQISRMTTLQALQTGNAELVQPADVPTSPSSPKTVRNVILAAILGLLLGVCLAVLLERLDRRLRDAKELEEGFGLPLLTAIPESKPLARSDDGMGQLLASDADAFHLLRARLRYFNVDREVQSILVTSAAPGEGKTTIAWNLAASAASQGVRTVLVESDFHQPALAQRTGSRPEPGLSELLSNQCSRTDAVQRVALEDRTNGRGQTRHLDVIVAGSLPPNPVELLGSEGMPRLLGELSLDYDLVVIDTPPLTHVADAIPLVGMVNGVIVVGRVNKTTRDEAHELQAQLESLDAPVLGLVANRMPRRRRSYYGYYPYGRSESRAGTSQQDE